MIKPQHHCFISCSSLPTQTAHRPITYDFSQQNLLNELHKIGVISAKLRRYAKPRIIMPSVLYLCFYLCYCCCCSYLIAKYSIFRFQFKIAICAFAATIHNSTTHSSVGACTSIFHVHVEAFPSIATVATVTGNNRLLR